MNRITNKTLQLSNVLRRATLLCAGVLAFAMAGAVAAQEVRETPLADGVYMLEGQGGNWAW